MKNTVDKIIETLSKEEFREFKYFLSGRANLPQEREDLALLEQMRNGLIPQSTNAIYQTRKRLKKQLEQFALLNNLHHDEFSKILRYVEMAKFLFRKKLYHEAWDYLIKAEKLTEEAEEYRLLDYIFDIQITYSYNIAVPSPPNLSVPELLLKRTQNRKKAEADSNANAAYSRFIYEIRENFSHKLSSDIDELTNIIFKEYALDEHVGDENLRIYCKLILMVCRALRAKRDYQALKTYSIKSYLFVENSLDKVTADFHADLLENICVASLRAKDYLNYEKYTKLYVSQMKKIQAGSQGQTYYDFIPYLDEADLYFVTNRLPEARENLLAVHKKYAHHTQSARIFCLLRMKLMAMHFKYNEYEPCIKLYQEMMAYDERKILNEKGFRLEILFNTRIYGIIFYYEDGDNYYATHLLQQLKRKYAGLLNSPEGKREKIFLKIMEKIIDRPWYLKSKAFQHDREAFVTLKTFVPGDLEYISLNAWLNSKASRNKNYYDCFLELVG